MRYWLIVPAAGVSRRFSADGIPKQYVQIEGRSILEWACNAFLADRQCAGAVFALAEGDANWGAVRERLTLAGLAPIYTAPGGSERAQSVRNALRVLANHAQLQDWVLVHDAARPCVLRADIDALLAVTANEAHGALLAAPLADTLKRAATPSALAGGPLVAVTLSRESLWRALTPQAARYGELCAALDAAALSGRVPTDEAQALEWQGHALQLVAGAASNLKVTTGDDLIVAQALLAARAHASV